MNLPVKRYFELPAQFENAARNWLEHDDRTPAAPRFASSVILVRDTARGPEAWLGYRGEASPLGAVAFPGGSVESSDDDPLPWLGPSPQQWAEVLGTEDVGLARRHVVAAIRELFEETGVLLAGPDAATVVEPGSPGDWMKTRQALAVGEISFSEVLARRGLALRTDLLRSVVNWLSPDFAHRRFNTRYFAATTPVVQEPKALEGKSAWGAWVCAPDVLAERDTSALGDKIAQPGTVGRQLCELFTPATEVMLGKLGKSRGCVAYLSMKRKTHLYEPRVVELEGRLMLEVQAPAPPNPTTTLPTVRS